MAGRFTAKAVEHITEVGFHHDGDGLYLQVVQGTRGISHSWCYRYGRDGRERRMGLGSAKDVSLAAARQKAAAARKLRADGIDPIEHREQQHAAQRREEARTRSFDQCAADYIAAHESGWRNPKHRQQWKNTLATYVSPFFGTKAVSMVGRDDVIRALRPIWKSKPETARRVRSRIEMILAYAEVIEARPEGSNVAGMRPVKITLGKQQRKKNHHPALPFSEAPAFMRDLRQRSGISARALELVILCAVRTGDIIGTNREDKPPMKWEHVDLKNRIWLIPSTKNDTEHRVPLSDATIKLLEDMRVRDLGEIVFPGMKADQPLSNMAMTNVIKRMNGDRKRQGLTLYADPKEGGDVTVHGFRSTFRDWAAERTNSPNEVVEMALAHAVGNKVEAAYRRGDLFEKRRRLMEEWQRFVHGSKRPQASKDMHDANRNDEFHFPLRADHSAPP